MKEKNKDIMVAILGGLLFGIAIVWTVLAPMFMGGMG